MHASICTRCAYACMHVHVHVRVSTQGWVHACRFGHIGGCPAPSVPICQGEQFLKGRKGTEWPNNTSALSATHREHFAVDFDNHGSLLPPVCGCGWMWLCGGVDLTIGQFMRKAAAALHKGAAGNHRYSASQARRVGRKTMLGPASSHGACDCMPPQQWLAGSRLPVAVSVMTASVRVCRSTMAT